MDIQHVTNPFYSKRFFKNYKIESGLSIVIETREHFLLSKYRKKEFFTIEGFINEELNGLMNFTNLPNDKISLLKNKIKIKYER